MSYNTRTLSNLKFHTGMHMANLHVWTQESQQCSNSLTGGNALNIRILLVSVPIMPIVIKLWPIAGKCWCLASALLGGHGRDFGLNVWREWINFSRCAHVA